MRIQPRLESQGQQRESDQARMESSGNRMGGQQRFERRTQFRFQRRRQSAHVQHLQINHFHSISFHNFSPKKFLTTSMNRCTVGKPTSHLSFVRIANSIRINSGVLYVDLSRRNRCPTSGMESISSQIFTATYRDASATQFTYLNRYSCLKVQKIPYKCNAYSGISGKTPFIPPSLVSRASIEGGSRNTTAPYPDSTAALMYQAYIGIQLVLLSV